MAPKNMSVEVAREWARQAFLNGLKLGHGDVEDIVGVDYAKHGEMEIDDHVTPEQMDIFKPKRASPISTEKKKKSSEERGAIGFNSDCCCARVWNGGFGAQCSKKSTTESGLCNAHQKKKDSLPEGHDLKHGYFNGERPLFMLTDADGKKRGDSIPWQDLKGEKKAEAAAKKAKKTSAKKDVKHPRPKGRSPSGKKWDHEIGEWVDASLTKTEAKTEVKAEAKVEAKVEAEAVEVVQDLVEKVAATEDLEEDVEGGGVGTVEEVIVPKITEEDCAPNPDSEEDKKDDEDEISFEGVKYILDVDTKEVYTEEEMELVGTWNGESIEWADESYAEMHESNKK